jgi:Tfp pilus assembly protein PilO
MDELKEKYKSLPFWARLLMALIIGILPGACSYLDEAEVLEASLQEARNAENTARSNFEKNRGEKANIPKLEEELAYTEEQLEKARKKLPEGYLVENVLTVAASSAKAAGVSLRKFTPTCELRGQGEFKYVEFPIDVQISGKYQQIASYLDKIVHAEMMIFIRRIELRLGDPVDMRDMQNEASDYNRQLRSRRDQTLNADFQMVVFRGMKDDEEAFFDNRTSCADESGEGAEFVPGQPVEIPPPPAPAPVEAPADAPPPPSHD